MQFMDFVHLLGLGSSASPFSNLPTEILLEIAANISERHTHAGYVVEACNLAALSRVSRRMRAVTLPIMHREAIVSSEKQLRALARMSKDLLACIRELNVFMDVGFLETWRAHAFSGVGSGTLYEVLLRILSQTPHISILRMRVAELHGVRSGWGKFAMSNRNNESYGIPIGRALGEALRQVPMARMSSLRVLEMDGFQDIELLVRMAPNLESLSMCMSGGFAPYVNAELVWALLAVPNLRRLVYTPTSLDLDEGVLTETKSSDGIPDSRESMLRLLHVLGRLVPKLEELNLQTRAFDETIEFRNRVHLIPAHALAPSLRNFDRLKVLRLPSTVLSEEESAAVRSPYIAFVARRSAMIDATHLEANIVKTLGKSQPSLRTVSFVRPGYPKEWKHHAITFSTNATGLRAMQPAISEAAEGQHPAWPYTSSLPLHVALRKWWFAPSGLGTDLILSYLSDLDSVGSVLQAIELGSSADVVRRVCDVIEKTRFVAMLFVHGSMYVGRHALR